MEKIISKTIKSISTTPHLSTTLRHHGTDSPNFVTNQDIGTPLSTTDLHRTLYVDRAPLFIDLTATDHLGQEGVVSRFDLHLILGELDTPGFPQLVTLNLHKRLFTVPTFTKLYTASQWSERECWDMFGIVFSGNNDLRRLLTDYGFTGFPLRKDFPVVGFVETRYDEELLQLRLEKVSLAQEMRPFLFQSGGQVV